MKNNGMNICMGCGQPDAVCKKVWKSKVCEVALYDFRDAIYQYGNRVGPSRNVVLDCGAWIKTHPDYLKVLGPPSDPLYGDRRHEVNKWTSKKICKILGLKTIRKVPVPRGVDSAFQSYHQTEIDPLVQLPY